MPSNCSAAEDSKNPLDCKEIKSVPPKGNQPWIFTESTDAEAEVPVLWPPEELTLWKRLMLGQIEVQRSRLCQRVSWLASISDLMFIKLSKLWETVEDKAAWHAAVHGVAKSWKWFSDWIETTNVLEEIKSSNWKRYKHPNIHCNKYDLLFLFLRF